MEAGFRYSLPANMRFVAAAFDIGKPYFETDSSDNVYQILGNVRHRGVELSLHAGDLYFWSERLDGMGDRDVYRAQPDGDGGFRRPELLPAPINSMTGDDGAWISPDGQTMLITYYDRGGCGGSDLFIAHRNGDNWTNPKNLGCDINSAFNEYAASIIPGTRNIVFPSTRPFKDFPEDSVALWIAELPMATK